MPQVAATSEKLSHLEGDRGMTNKTEPDRERFLEHPRAIPQSCCDERSEEQGSGMLTRGEHEATATRCQHLHYRTMSVGNQPTNSLPTPWLGSCIALPNYPQTTKAEDCNIDRRAVAQRF